MIQYEHSSQRGDKMPKIIENLRETILLEGKKLLLNKNYKDLNIREIAKNCNIGIGTFYNYFSNKEELVSEIFRMDWKKVSCIINDLKTTDEPCKEKFRTIYMSLDSFISSYISIFYEMAVNVEHTCGCKESNKFNTIYSSVSELIDLEKEKGNIKSSMESSKLAQLIISNLVYLNKNKYMSFDELYHSFNL